MSKENLAIQIWWLQGILKVKNAHFWLTFVAQKRYCLTSLVSSRGRMEGHRYVIVLGAFKCQLAPTSLVFGSFTSEIIASEIP